MSRQAEVYQWMMTVREHLPQLSKAQARVLALWSFGVVVVGACGSTSVAGFLAQVLQQKENTVRQRLREWYWEASAKQGDQRQSVAVAPCFGALLRWVLAWWTPEEQRLALALDATTLAQRFTVLAVSVVYRGCAIPVAWVVVRAAEAGAWQPHWRNVLRELAASVPPSWTVIVLADRGLYAPWLFEQIVQLTWHPFLRINQGGLFRIEQQPYRPLTSLLTESMRVWSGQVTCFKTRPLACTLVAGWDTHHQEPWLILTDLAPDAAQVCWYGLRTWIEGGFKDLKRGGWQWQQTRITDPNRAERFWLILAVATLWMVSVGGEAEMNLPASNLDELPSTHVARQRPHRRSRPRWLSCFRRGRLTILAALITGVALPRGRFQPEPWPDHFDRQTGDEKTYP
jgi:hypothetical protein